MNYYDHINIISIIDQDIFINEKVYGNIYEYIKKIIENYKEYSIIIFYHWKLQRIFNNHLFKFSNFK